MLPAADELLAPDYPDKPAWARFDAVWYLARYAAAREYGADDADSALEYYLKIGAQLGHSPSPLFDEAFYLARNPDVFELVRQGTYSSGFDHFCQHGHRSLTGHWLFDDLLYLRLYDDMTIENLDQHRVHGRYDHYLKSGQHERRTGHSLFDAGYYRLRALEAGASEADIDIPGPFVDYLYRLQSGAPELQPSIYFEPLWYLEIRDARVEIERGKFGSAIEHYLCNESPDQHDPVPQFSETFYRETYRDIGHAIDNGEFRNGYQHFVQFGAFELRRPHPEIDLIHYRDAHPRVRDDLNAGSVRDAFAHLRMIGLQAGLSFCAPDSLPAISENAAKQLFIRRARNNLALFGRQKLDFACAVPAVSVLMVLYNKFELTMLALASLRANFAGDIELVLIDNASLDDTRRVEQFVAGARVVHLTENTGFARAANLALGHASAPAILYLNNDVELGHGAIAAALTRLMMDPRTSAVGGKIIRTHGALQEAGSIIWQDGTTTGYMRDASPLAPEANYLRAVDYCSAVFLLCRAKLLKILGGFDESFSPAYYEDADLCVRIAQAGGRILYDPAVTVYHLEFGSAANADASQALMRRGLKIFRKKHEVFLRQQRPRAAAALVAARAAGAAQKHVLFLEDTVPLRRLGSGFVRANDIVHAIAAAGYQVTVFPINGAPHDLMGLFGDLPETAEIMHDQDINTLEPFLAGRPHYYDIVWVSRTHNLARVRPHFEAAGVPLDRIPVILDTEAVVSVRDAAFASLHGDDPDFDFDESLRAEFSDAGSVQQITVVNRGEAGLLADIGLSKPSLLGTISEPDPTANDFASRAGLLFVAAIHQPDSPNLDALHWYMEEILPALAAEMHEVPVLNFVGYTGPDVDLSPFRGHKFIKLHGPVGDLRPFYNAARVFIAPTRYAAGTPYKIYETAAHGLPSVVTDLLAQQLGWAPGVELLAAPRTDARRFAAQIAVLYRTRPVWTKLREGAVARITAENGPKRFNTTVTHLLKAALAAPVARPKKPAGARAGRAEPAGKSASRGKAARVLPRNAAPAG